MADWLEELKIQRSKQTQHDPYQQYQAHMQEMDKLDGAGAIESVGKMQGKKFKKIASENIILNIFNQIIKRI